MPQSQHRLHPVLDYWRGLDREAPVQERCYSINIGNSTPPVFASREKSLLLAPKQGPAFTSISRRCLVHSSEYHFFFFFLKQKYWGSFKFSSKPLVQAPSDSWCNKKKVMDVDTGCLGSTLMPDSIYQPHLIRILCCQRIKPFQYRRRKQQGITDQKQDFFYSASRFS